MLVAGFACVDFSQLNRHCKNLISAPSDDNNPAYLPANGERWTREERHRLIKEGVLTHGESGGTFFAILDLADEFRPPVVILENLVSCPWEEVGKYWNDIGYATQHIRVDTKRFYLPATRMRGYMIAIDTKSPNCMDAEEVQHAVQEWKKLFQAFERPASSSVDDILLTLDDLTLESSLHRAQRETSNGKFRKTSEWVKSAVRHQNLRIEENIGRTNRPYTGWKRNGTATLPMYGDRKWINTQSERVCDSLDILYLLGARDGVDFEFKS